MARTQSKSFWSKYLDRWTQTGSLVCVGLDSQVSKLPDSVKRSANPIWEFNRAIIDATKDYACAYKPNLAFYLEDGCRGWDALAHTVDYVPSEIPVIIDCKAGDIGNTMRAYVKAFLDDLGADCITFNPLMGTDVASPILQNEQKFAFALALTSNPSAADFLKQDGLSERISSWIETMPLKQIGAVVGGTQSSELATMRSLMPERLFLVPGIGAQGGDLQAVMQSAIHSKDDPRLLINSSRGIIFADDSSHFARGAAAEAAKLKASILEALEAVR